MFAQLPSVRGFQPKFYSGGPARFHLPLLYDLIAAAQPKRAVVLGFGNGDAFFTWAQAAVELRIDCDCVAVRRDRPGDSADDDAAWSEGKNYGEEFYGPRTRFFADRAAALKAIDDGSVDMLLLDDCDSGSDIRADLVAWEPKLAADAIVLLHGIGLERVDSPKAGWDERVGDRPSVLFTECLGLAVAVRSGR